MKPMRLSCWSRFVWSRFALAGLVAATVLSSATHPRAEENSEGEVGNVGETTESGGGERASVKPDDKRVCLEAFDQSQTLRQENKLVATRQQLLMCARNVCPEVLRAQCTDWLGEVEKDLPTVVLSAKDSRGKDLIDVAVKVDGVPLVSRIDGTAVAVDPGVRVFRFEARGEEPVESRIVIHMGGKSRAVSVQFEASTDPDENNETTTPEQTQASSGIPSYVPYVVGGVGVVGIGASFILGLQFKGKLDDMDKCKPFCSQSDVDSASTTRVLTFVSAGVGVAALGVATYLYFAGSSPMEVRTEVGKLPRLEVMPVRGGAVGSFGTMF